MKISTQAIKYLNQHYNSAGDPAPEGVDKLVKKIGAQLGAVEETINFGKRFESVVIVKVVSCDDHPNADRLHICKIDDGGKTPDVERDENGHVQVICGAPNVHTGMLTAWLPPGSTVPNTLDNDPFVLEARDIRGQKSNGMMASPKELSLGDSHEGILEVDEELGTITPGTMFADAFHLRDDVIIDMENKMFTHRPDCFGWLGIAREIEGIHRRPYKSPEWYTQSPDFERHSGLDPESSDKNNSTQLPLEITNELPNLVPRFTAITISDVQIKPSPVWLQVDLARAGLRPINNIVDYTNFYMLLTGQPLHAYDYDKVKALSDGDKATIVVRNPKNGEKITLLNGKEIEPRAEAIMIATNKQLIGVGGVMGGGETEVDAGTKNIIIECANFDMYSVRRTSMAHGLFTDAVTRFNKGQSPLQNLAVLWKITDQIIKNASGKVASEVIDDNHVHGEDVLRGSVHAPVKITPKYINQRLGWKLSAEEITKLLENVEFKVVRHSSDQAGSNGQEDLLEIAAPFWRTDIEMPEDIVEEIGRLYGYDHLILELPKRDITPAIKDPVFDLKSLVRSTLSAAGANELLTYTFVHGNLLDRSGQDRELAFELSNALSPDLQYYRLSLTPSLLDKVHSNIKAGYGSLALFEINKAYGRTDADDEGLPLELTRLGLVFSADDKTAAAQYAGAPYYQAKEYLSRLLDVFDLSTEIALMPLKDAQFDGHALTEQMTAPFDANRSAVLMLNDQIVGVIGEYRTAVRKALKLPVFSAGFEIFSSALGTGNGQRYTKLPRFPKVDQDICLKVPADKTYGQVFDLVWTHLDQNRPDSMRHTLLPVDIYQREDDQDHKQITLRVSLASYERTLTDEEVNNLLNSVAQAAKETLSAERI